MKEHDVIVIGGGLAGLFAAITAAARGRQVTVITQGVGAIAIAGGMIDLLGYGPDGRPVRSFNEGLAELAPDHPYVLVGQKYVEAAVQKFLSLCEAAGYPYTGGLQANHWVPTALGTLKPSGLIPLSMDAAGLKTAEAAFVVGFEGLKDYCAQVIAEGLVKYPGYPKNYGLLSLKTGFEGGRDISALDIARWLESEEGLESFIAQLSRKAAPHGILLLPPILGTRPEYGLFRKIEQATKCRVVETVGLPPAVTGFRLRKLLLGCLKKLNVRIIEQAGVVRANTAHGRCHEITTGNLDRERSYQAKSYILATGGFFGGGLRADAGQVTEAVFNLPVAVPAQMRDWSHEQLLFTPGQPFAKFGVKVDAAMRPIDKAGQVLLENVYVAGNTLAGYDYCYEKSGNGVALATAYKAGCEGQEETQ